MPIEDPVRAFVTHWEAIERTALTLHLSRVTSSARAKGSESGPSASTWVPSTSWTPTK